MFLFRNVILLRYMETDSAIGRAVNVLKMRNSDHSKTVHQFHITDTGVTIGPKLDSITGVLGWTALRSPNVTGAPQAQAPPPAT